MFAASLLLVAPAAVLADGGITETGTSTYVVNPAKGQINVTIVLTEHNTKPSVVTPDGRVDYYYRNTEIGVEAEASAVSVTSNGGAVSQTPIADASTYYRYIKLTYPPVYYGGTRTITATYSIPAGPHAPGNFRAGKAYASLCAVGNGYDSGSVSITLPSAFELYVDTGDDLTQAATAPVDQQTWTSGPLTSPYKFWTCVDAEDAENMTHASIVAAGQTFDIQGWPEDTTWSTSIGGYVTADVQRLEDLTGLTMPGGTIQVREAGDYQLGNYGGTYNAKSGVADIPETIRKDTVAHELSHIWFNHDLIQDKWVSEGLAGFSEQAAGTGNYIACKEPGKYPDAKSSPDLMTWQVLTNTSTTTEEDVMTYQYDAACYIFTKVANDMGPANMKTVIGALNGHEMAYVGATPHEKLADAKTAMTSQEVLDLIDERGMVPAGVADMDAAGNLLSDYGIFTKSELAARSASRATYHELVAAAKNWKLPYAVRGPMGDWNFDQADPAMATVKQIFEVRDSIEAQLSGFTLDKTAVEKQFEAASNQADLTALLTLIQKEAAAAAKIDEATKLKDGSHSLLETIGLLATDVQSPLTQARTDLTNAKPDSATTNAQSVIDRIHKASDQGVLRAGAGVASLALILIVLAFVFLIPRRRRPAVAMATPIAGWAQPTPIAGWGQPTPPWNMQPTAFDQTPQARGLPPTPFGQTPQAQGLPPTPFGQTPQAQGLPPTPFGQTPQAQGLPPTPFDQTPQARGLPPTPFDQAPQARGLQPTPWAQTPHARTLPPTAAPVEPEPFATTGRDFRAAQPMPFDPGRQPGPADAGWAYPQTQPTPPPAFTSAWPGSPSTIEPTPAPETGTAPETLWPSAAPETPRPNDLPDGTSSDS